MKNRATLLAITIVVVTLAVLFGTFRDKPEDGFPFGDRRALLRNLHSALMNYAADNAGKFPNSEKGPEAALAKLHPLYCFKPIELAGLSGDIGSVESALKGGRPLTKDLTSWRYQQGLRNDDSKQLALVWENSDLVNASSRKSTSRVHAAILIGGDITNVPSADWESFLQAQKVMRAEALSLRQKQLSQDVSDPQF